MLLVHVLSRAWYTKLHVKHPQLSALHLTFTPGPAPVKLAESLRALQGQLQAQPWCPDSLLAVPGLCRVLQAACIIAS